jgi:hypothetical protein
VTAVTLFRRRRYDRRYGPVPPPRRPCDEQLTELSDRPEKLNGPPLPLNPPLRDPGRACPGRACPGRACPGRDQPCTWPAVSPLAARKPAGSWLGIPLSGPVLLVLVANSSVVYYRAREAEDHLPPSRPGVYRGWRVWPEDPATVRAKARMRTGYQLARRILAESAGRRRCRGCPAERFSSRGFSRVRRRPSWPAAAKRLLSTEVASRRRKRRRRR